MNKEVKELAKALFIKRYIPGEYLTEKNTRNMTSIIQDCFEVAKLFEQLSKGVKESNKTEEK
jgi:hypothetical protein